jgi:hypothetical protein
MFRVVLPPIIKSAYNCVYSIWYLSHRYCYLPLSWKSWNWFECAVGGVSPYGQHLFVNILCCIHIFCPQKNAQRHAVLSWYMYSGAPPSFNSCYACTVMRIPIVVSHNKTRYCCYLAVTVSRT